MHRDSVHCLACEAPVPRRTHACPTCGYDVERHDRRRRWFGALGTVLTVSGVLAPLGLPLVWAAHRHRLAAEGTVSRRAAVPLGDHLASVLRCFCSFDRQPTGSRRFRRGGSRPVGESPGPSQR